MSFSVTASRSCVDLFRTTACTGILLGALFSSKSAMAQSGHLQQPVLTPQPREIHATQLVAVQSAVVTVPGGDAEDFFAAHDLEQTFTERGIVLSPTAGPADLTVVLLRKESPEAAQILTKEHLEIGRAHV